MFGTGGQAPEPQAWRERPHLQRELHLVHAPLPALVMLGDPPVELAVGLLQLQGGLEVGKAGLGPSDQVSSARVLPPHSGALPNPALPPLPSPTCPSALPP